MNSSTRMIAWTVWLIASLFYAYQFILRVMPNVMLNDMMQRYNLDAVSFGQLSGVYYIGYSLMHLPIGMMLDRFGPKKVVPGCILLTVAGLIPLLLADHWVYPIAGRFLIGMGSTAAILGVFKIIRMIFSEQRFPRMLSLSVTIGLMGAIYGGGPVSYMREAFGYQTVIQLLALAGIILAVTTYWIVPKMEMASQKTILSDIKEVFRNRRVILTCIFAGFMVGPLEGFADVWGTAFLKQVYGLDGALAASLPSMIFIGMCFGGPVLSFIAEKTGSYLATIIGAGAAMAACFGIFINWHLASSSLIFCFVLVGICCAYQILAIYKASTYVRPQVAGLTTAVANMIIMIFGYVIHALMGVIIHASGGPAVSKALFYGTLVIPLALFLGTIGFTVLFKREKEQRFEGEKT